jgi:hypothetical protein
MLFTKSCECSQSSPLHGASQFQPLCLHLPLFPSRMCGHTGIFTFTSQRSSWPDVMSSRAEYSGYAAYPRSFRVSHKSAGKPPSSRQFKWVHPCASTVMDPEADIWNKWQMSKPDANTCTKISSRCYKERCIHRPLLRVSNLPQDFEEYKVCLFLN